MSECDPPDTMAEASFRQRVLEFAAPAAAGLAVAGACLIPAAYHSGAGPTNRGEVAQLQQFETTNSDTVLVADRLQQSGLTARAIKKTSAKTPSPSGISTVPSSNTCQVDLKTDQAGNRLDQINALVKAGHDMYAGGDFDGCERDGQHYARQNLFAFNASSGEVTNFNAQVNGEIFAEAASANGQDLYIGGSFTSVNGVSRENAAEIDLKTGEVTSWNPDANATVRSIMLAHKHLVLAGDFTTLDGHTHNRWGSVTRGTGRPTSWLNLAVDGFHEPGGQHIKNVVASPDGEQAFVIGNFTSVGDHARDQLAMLNIGKKHLTVAKWHESITAKRCGKEYGTYLRGVAWTPDGNHFATVSTGGPHPHTICDAAAIWKNAPNNKHAKPLHINYTGGDTLSGVACTDASCFVSGHNRWLDNTLDHKVSVTPCSDQAPFDSGAGPEGYGCKAPTALDRPGVGELNLKTWKATGWDPTDSRERSVNNTMVLTKQGLWIGTDAGKFGGQPHNDLGFFPRS